MKKLIDLYRRKRRAKRAAAISLPPPKQKQRFQLCDVWSYCHERDDILVDRERTENFIASLGDVSEEDKKWRQIDSNPRPYTTKFSNVTVIPGSRVVVDAHGTACCDELTYADRVFSSPPKDKAMSITDEGLLEIEPFEYAPESVPTGVHLTCEYEHNYFHWIAEVLARLFLFEAMTTNKCTPLLVTGGLHPNLYALLDLVRDPKRPVIRMEKGMSYKVDDLIYPSDVSCILESKNNIPSYKSMYVPASLIKAMASHIKDSVPKSESSFPKKLFLVRNRSYRIPANQDEVAALLISHGFTQLDLGEFTSQEQIELFSQAEQIIAPSGATCSNIVWMPKGARALILSSDHPFFICPYWDAFGRSANVNVSYLISPRIQKRDSPHDDYVVDLSILADTLLDIAGTIRE